MSSRPSGSGVIAVSANTSWALTNYRLGLLRALREAGYSLVALVPADDGSARLEAEGIEIRAIPIAAHSTSPYAEAKLLAAYLRHLRELRPAAFLGFTIKPNIYGSLAARLAATPVINNITGLGLAFTNRGLLRLVVGALYRVAFRSSHRVFFQNRESRDLFLSQGLVRKEQAALLPGSGIDLEKFTPSAGTATENAEVTFLLPSRLMWSKGIGEYSAAAARIRKERPGTRFQVLGALEPNSNRDAIDEAQMREWEGQGIEYLGATSDVRPFFEAADCVVLPSYYPEGVPRALIEAAAMGKPVVTTDTPGCRDVVDSGQTGYLCAARSVESLVEAMLRVVDVAPSGRAAMGSLARKKMEREFGEQRVIDAYLEALNTLASKSP